MNGLESCLDTFNKWRIEKKEHRRTLVFLSSESFSTENALFVICCWDYIYRPDDTKAEGLFKIFIERTGLAYVNVPDASRLAAMGQVQEPMKGLPFPRPQKQRLLAETATENRGGLKLGDSTASAGNYNLVTNSIAETMPEIVRLLQNNISNLVAKIANGIGKMELNSTARENLGHVHSFWGTKGMKNLGFSKKDMPKNAKW